MTGMPQPITRSAPPLAGRSIAAQRWSDLTFLHWRVDATRVAPLLPRGVRPDEHDGSSWVGLIPFHLHRASLLGGPPMPYLGDFTEINVRLYGVDDAGRRGVVFRSLEASRLLAVLAARIGFGLPYHWAAASMRREGSVVSYASRRHVGGAMSRLVTRVGERIDGDPLSDFLTARWGMFTRRLGRTVFVPNEHEPWPLHAAELVGFSDGLLAAAGLPGIADRAPDSVLFSPGVATRFGRPQR